MYQIVLHSARFFTGTVLSGTVLSGAVLFGAVRFRALRFFVILVVLSATFASCSRNSSNRVDSNANSGKITISVVDPGNVLSHQLRNPEVIKREGVEALPVADQTQLNSDEITIDNFFSHPAHQGPVNSLVVTRDGGQAYSGGVDGRLIVSRLVGAARADADSSKGRDWRGDSYVTTEVLLESSRPILSLALSPDEKTLAIAQYSRVTLFEIPNRRITSSLTRVKGRIGALAWDPRGELVAMGNPAGDVMAWRVRGGSYAGSDNLKAVEHYQGGVSPVIGISFHPSGRVFFTAERAGAVSVWRLLRTESALGLRDQQALADKEPVSKERQRFASLGEEIEELWLDPTGQTLFVTTVSGLAYQWKIRGLVQQPGLRVGKDAAVSLTGLTVNSVGSSRRSRIVVTAQRDQRLRFWCATNSWLVQLAQVSRAELAARNGRVVVEGHIAETMRLTEPLSQVRAGIDSPLLWAAQKTGSLMLFNADILANLPPWSSRVTKCEDNPA